MHAWDLDGLAGAGAIRSTAGDMLTYLEAQLHPEKFPALRRRFRIPPVRADVPPGYASRWRGSTKPDTGIYQHNGGTAGFTSYAFFRPQRDCAAIVLINTGPNLALGPDQLGEHIRQRLAGEPAVSLARPVVSGKGGLLERAPIVRGVLDHAVCGRCVRPMPGGLRSGVGSVVAAPAVPACLFFPAIGLFLPVPDRLFPAAPVSPAWTL